MFEGTGNTEMGKKTIVTLSNVGVGIPSVIGRWPNILPTSGGIEIDLHCCTLDSLILLDEEYINRIRVVFFAE